MAGIGRRRDGWTNRDLNVDAIIALSRELTADKNAVYAAIWHLPGWDQSSAPDGRSARRAFVAVAARGCFAAAFIRPRA